MEMDVSRAQSHRILDMGDAAHQGEEVTIMRDGQPWLRLLPCPDYTPPPPKSYDELQAEWWASLSPEAKAFWSDPEVQEALTEAVLERWAYLPERELCAECLAKYRADGRADDPKDAAPEPAAAKGGG